MRQISSCATIMQNTWLIIKITDFNLELFFICCLITESFFSFCLSSFLLSLCRFCPRGRPGLGLMGFLLCETVLFFFFFLFLFYCLTQTQRPSVEISSVGLLRPCTLRGTVPNTDGERRRRPLLSASKAGDKHLTDCQSSCQITAAELSDCCLCFTC